MRFGYRVKERYFSVNITIYHNPACSKSRKTLEIIRQHGLEPKIIEYLRSPPGEAEILRLAKLLGVQVAEILRSNNADVGSDRPPEENEALAAWLARHPQSLQRPIVVDEDGKRAVIGRPPESVHRILPGL
ncbi:MAG: ArsC/Spx/MgsR family protein [Woeseia sp.]